MTGTESESRRVLLLGLQNRSLAKLADILLHESHDVCSRPFLPLPQSVELIEQLGADVVYCAADPEQYSPLLEAVKQTGSSVPVVVVSSSRDVSEWLDAIEAGAWDYVAIPFETAHIRHVLENAVRCSNPKN